MELITKCLCKTSDLGVNGYLFGGKMLSWLDESGAILASQVCKTKDLVTKTMGGIDFKATVLENHIVAIYGEVTTIGTTSIGLSLIAKRCDVFDGEEIEVCSIDMVFVRFSEGKKRPIDADVRTAYKHLAKKKDEK